MGNVRQIAVLSAAVVLGVSAAACRRDGAAPARARTAEEADRLGVQAAGHHHDPEVRWRTVDSFDELVRSSDLVVRGTVESRRPAWAIQGWGLVSRWLVTSHGDGAMRYDLPLVISTVRVRQILRAGEEASFTVPGGTIQVVELGGRLEDGCFGEPADKPVLKRGEEAVFFLSGMGKPGAYQVVGGWQGRMWVTGGKVRSLAADVHPEDPAATAMDGRPLEVLVQAVTGVPGKS